MPSNRTLLCGAIFLSLTYSPSLIARGQEAATSSAPTFRVTSRLVFLDVTVLDKRGHPVVSGLTKDDFTITEDKKPQPIFSFEAPDTVGVDASTAGESTTGNSPATIFVLDLLNSKSEDFAFLRQSMHKYLAAQPPQLDSPAELMVLGNQSLEMAQGYTRNRTDLLYALDHVPRALPYKLKGAWNDERLAQSIEALQQIALQNESIPGRKNIVWLGYGGPSKLLDPGDPTNSKHVRFFVHDTTNMLVDARISLFLIYPGLKGAANPDYFRIGPFSMGGLSAMYATQEIGDHDPFAGDVNFGLFVNATGGKVFDNRNDVDAEVRQSQELGSTYYTLTYRPSDGDANGKFRRIRVTLRDPNLQVLTKTGYYAPEPLSEDDPRQQAMSEISEAAQSTVPFDALNMTIVRILRHPNNGTAELTMLLKSTNVNWEAADNGKSTTNLAVGAVSLSARRDILSSNLQKLTILSNTQDATRLAKSSTLLTVSIRVPRQTHSVRVIVRTAEGGQIGAVELDRKSLDGAPEAPTLEPRLLRRTRQEETPAKP